MMAIGSLCSGIGGLELGLEWAGLGETVFQVEIDPFCRRILGKHWPRAKQFEDLRDVGKRNLPHADLICFGFPCQDVSSAGAKGGLGGARSGLFYECARIVAELLPEWVVVENVASGSKLWVDPVLAELGRLGYASLPIPLSAGDVGALHQRARVFIVAHADRQHEPSVTRLAEVAGASATASAGAPHTHGKLVWQQQQRDSRWGDGVRDEREALADFPSWRSAEPQVVRVVHGLSGGLDTTRRGALGNAVVPQCAEVIGWIIRGLAG